MKFNITFKLLFSFFLATVVVVGCMLFLIKWSFEKGFLQYVNTMEQQVQANLADSLVEVYNLDGGWDELRNNRRRWIDLQISSFMDTDMARRRISGDGEPDVSIISPPPPARERFREPLSPDFRRPRFQDRPAGPGRFQMQEGFRINPRISLFDEDKNILIGRIRNPDRLQFKPIRSGEKIIGYLGILPRRELFAGRELQFTEQQGRAFTLIALIIVIISTLMILPISRSLVKPIKRVTDATRMLASGRYDIRIPPGSNDEIGQLSRDFNSLADTLEQNEKSRRQWIADISHELRTPLTILRGEIEAMQDGIRPISPERLNALHSQVMNLNRLVGDLYELSMSDIGALNYQKQNVDLEEIVTATLAGVSKDFNEKNISIDLDYGAGDRFIIFADPDRLKQLFTNLLVNSYRYTDPGGALKIGVTRENEYVVIALLDSAPGVHEKDLPHLFERLYRPDSSRNRQTGGAGLGLSICKNIVEAHGGRISAHASPLGGLGITVALPLET